MYRIAVFNTKPYDREHFETVLKTEQFKDFEAVFFENKLDNKTAIMSKGFDAVCPFVNDTIDSNTIDVLKANGVRLIAMRCAGFNNLDVNYAKGKIDACRVPAYSPHSVAEHAFAMLLTLNRRLQHAYVRVREFNFALSGLEGTVLNGKTMGIVGYGKIGKAMADISKGFGMNVIAYDKYVTEDSGVTFCALDELLKSSDYISLHCPLTEETFHMINSKAVENMKTGCVIINTSRGALIESHSLLENLKNGKLGGACLDVYEEEENLFYSDLSSRIVQDDVISRLISLPNVLVTGHQAFLTKEALDQIAITTLDNIRNYLKNGKLTNAIV